MRKPQDFSYFPVELARRTTYGPYRAVITYVVDGDTFDVFVDAGWNDYPYRTIRLKDVNAPELNTPAGRDARDYVRTLLPEGTPCVLTTYKDVQTFGRYVADVLVMAPDPGSPHHLAGPFDLAEHLVKAGYVKPVVRALSEDA